MDDEEQLQTVRGMRPALPVWVQGAGAEVRVETLVACVRHSQTRSFSDQRSHAANCSSASD